MRRRGLYDKGGARQGGVGVIPRGSKVFGTREGRDFTKTIYSYSIGSVYRFNESIIYHLPVGVHTRYRAEKYL